ncbi:MAG: hypothetical protein K1060chlam5_00402 [Candidatus Anoxychlamydiales bacterium]|nr:hypothetical protein [Candidatus Anoxychlamydiales bacterium]
MSFNILPEAGSYKLTTQRRLHDIEKDLYERIIKDSASGLNDFYIREIFTQSATGHKIDALDMYLSPTLRDLDENTALKVHQYITATLMPQINTLKEDINQAAQNNLLSKYVDPDTHDLTWFKHKINISEEEKNTRIAEIAYAKISLDYVISKIDERFYNKAMLIEKRNFENNLQTTFRETFGCELTNMDQLSEAFILRQLQEDPNFNIDRFQESINTLKAKIQILTTEGTDVEINKTIYKFLLTLIDSDYFNTNINQYQRFINNFKALQKNNYKNIYLHSLNDKFKSTLEEIQDIFQNPQSIQILTNYLEKSLTEDNFHANLELVIKNLKDSKIDIDKYREKLITLGFELMDSIKENGIKFRVGDKDPQIKLTQDELKKYQLIIYFLTTLGIYLKDSGKVKNYKPIEKCPIDITRRKGSLATYRYVQEKIELLKAFQDLNTFASRKDLPDTKETYDTFIQLMRFTSTTFLNDDFKKLVERQNRKFDETLTEIGKEYYKTLPYGSFVFYKSYKELGQKAINKGFSSINYNLFINELQESAQKYYQENIASLTSELNKRLGKPQGNIEDFKRSMANYEKELILVGPLAI